jgi:histidinol-phosphate phosphatase family protein
VGRGFFTREDVEKVHAALEQRLLKNNLKLDGIYYCPHHPDDHCRCRKPEVGLVKQACQQFQVDLKKSVVIGDRESDLELGKRIGSQTILVLTGYGKLAQKSLRIKPDYIAPNLFEAARWIINKK